MFSRGIARVNQPTGKLFSSYFFALSVLYTASTNMSVVHGPDVDPYRPSQGNVGFAVYTCSSVMPFLIMSCTRSRTIVSMSR